MSGKADSSSASKANIAEEEVEEEEAEDSALLTGGKKRRRPPSKKKGKSQPASSAAHEADAVDDDGFAYNAISSHDMVSSNNEWRLKGAKEAQDEENDGTFMILDAGCHLMKHGLSEGQWNCCLTQVLSTSQTVKAPWRVKSAESGFHTSHLCSKTSPLSMRVRFPFSRPFRG